MTWIATRKGRAFDLLAPRARDVDFDEIADVLSRVPRFGAHARAHYSVAEHCCRVADILPLHLRVYGLLHDAHETYIGDILGPVKRALQEIVPVHAAPHVCFAIDELERRVDGVVHEAAGVAFPLPEEAAALVRIADQQLLATELRDLLPRCDRPFVQRVKPLPEFIVPWSAGRAAREFSKRLAKWTQAERRAA